MDIIIVGTLLGMGLVSLFMGRKLFWVYVGIAGFLLGAVIGGFAASDYGMAAQLALALVFGIGAAVLSIYLQKPMAALAAFVSGGLIVALIYVVVRFGGFLSIFTLPMILQRNEVLVIFLVAGLIFAVVTWLVFEWALIVLSALVGALLTTAVAASFLPGSAPPVTLLVLLFGLMALGIWVQASMMKKAASAPRPQVSYPSQPGAPPLSGSSAPTASSASYPPPAPPVSGVVCRQCGAVARPGARFCNGCGAALTP